MALHMDLSILGTVLFVLAVSASREPRNTKDVYKVTTIEEPPYVEFDESTGVSGNAKFKGFVPDLFKHIAEKAGIKYEFQKVADGKYGQKTNGQWNGMIGEVMRKVADIAAAPVTISKEREKISEIEFTDPFMTIETTFLALKPSDGSDVPFANAEDLAKQDVIKYGAVRDGTTARFFETSTNPAHQKMKNKMVYVDSNEEGVTKVRNSDGKYVFIIESMTAKYWINKPPCTLTQVSRVDGYENKYGFVLPKNSELKRKFNDALKTLKTDGTIQELTDKWWENTCGSASTVIASTSLMVSMVFLSVFKLL